MRTLKQEDKEGDGRKSASEPAALSPQAETLAKEVRLQGFGPVLLYSETSGEDGVRVHLRDDKALLARLHELPLQDLPDSNIDILLSQNSGELSLVGGEEGLELFGGETGGDLGLSLEHPSADSSSEESKCDGRAGSRKNGKASSPNRQGPQRCPVCGKVFGNASALAKHKLTHSDERRYVCTMCAKAFKRQDHLNGHMLTHRNKKPYECKAEGCGKSYCDARSLRRHTENHHSGSGSSSTTPEASPPTCIQYAPPPPPREQKVLNGKSQNSSETLSKNQLELIQQIMQKTQTQSTSKNSESSKTQVISSSAVNSASSSTKSWTVQANHTITKTVVSSTKPVECNLCHRKFKNIPALNGHMRLHGGYFKKETEPRRWEKRDVNTPPLQTASVSVRALIEEKIILKRITKPCSTSNVQSEDTSGDSIKKDHNPQKSLSLDHPIIKKVPKLGVKRTSSDPGLLKQNESPTGMQQHKENGPFSLEEYNEETEMLSPSLQENVFEDAQGTVLLEGVDSSSLEESINAADLEDITIEDYHSGESLPSPQSFQHHKDVQSVLNSPLPANLADFAYTHSQAANNEPQTSSQNYTTSSLTSSDLNFSATSVSQTSSFSSHQSNAQNEDTSTTSSSFYSSSITSTSEPADAALHTSRSSHPASSTPNNTLQSQMMPNSEDPLLSSSPKDFVPRKRFDFQTIKLLQNSSIEPNAGQGLAGIVLDRNGEIKLIHSAASQPTKQISANVGNYVSVKPENGPKIVKAVTIPCKSTYIRNGEKIGAVLINEVKEEINEEVFATPSLAISPVHLMRKRPRLDNGNQNITYRSRLRNVRKSYGGSLPFTPPPMLPPTRQGQGLYWQATTASPSSTTLNKGSNWEEGTEIPESDAKPHINIGPNYQSVIPNCYVLQGGKEKLKEHLLWDSKLSKVVSDSEVDKYLEFACCAAVPGGGRNKEHALHLLHICHGRIQEAMLQLMQPTPWLPSGHPLLTFEYSDSERWTLNEMETFYQALLKYDKDFSSVSREVSSKTAKQCVQFYYVWKKVCPDDYKRLRLIRKRYRETDHEVETSKIEAQNGDTDLVSTTSTEGRLFVCEYNDCCASFNSRAALNGHIRIHVGGTATRCGTPDKRSPLQVTESVEEFPCKLCGKVFSKVKSRSAHMKSHRPPDTDTRKIKSEVKNEQEQLSTNKIATIP